MTLSPDKRDAILQALRIGAVPARGLDTLAVGLERVEPGLREALAYVARGHGALKALRGEYGSGKTFAARWLQEQALLDGFAVSEVQVSETETPLYRLETVYRRLMERLGTPGTRGGALGAVLEAWLAALERDAVAGGVDAGDDAALEAAVAASLEARLAPVATVSPAFATAVRAIHTARFAGDAATQQQLVAWLSGQPNVAADVRRRAGLRGDIDHFGALGFVAGLLAVLRDAGYRGLVFVLDEVETLQRARSDSREKSLNALRQLVDELSADRFPGLFLVLTGTPSFFDGPTGVRLAPALASRLATDFSADPRFDNPRAPQVRLPGFDHTRLVEVGRRVRDVFAHGSSAPDRVASRCDDPYIDELAQAVGGRFGASVAVAPRVFLKKLVADVLDRIELFDDFDPRAHYRLTLRASELTETERAAASVDDIELDA
jgi:hypothetical protein